MFRSHFTTVLRRAVARAGFWAAGPVASLSVGLGFGVVGVVLQLVAPVNHDLGWLLVGTRRMLDGSQLYVDGFLDVNPPLVLALLSPAVIAARLTGLAELDVARSYVLLCCGLSLWFCAGLSRELFKASESASFRYLVAGIVFVFGIWPAANGDEMMAFGQREHFVVLFQLPYLLVLAMRLRSREPSRSAAIAAGLLCAVALGMKPHYVPTVVALECWLIFRRRSFAALLRPESCVIVLAGASYLVVLFLFVPAYLSSAVPLALDTYWAYQQPIVSLLSFQSAIALALALAGVALARGTGAAVARVLWLASLGSYVAYLLGGTIWAYHRLPFQSFALLALVMGLAGRLPLTRTGGVREQGTKPTAAVAVLAISALVALLVWRAPWMPGRTLQSYGPFGSARWTPTPALASAVQRHAPRGTLLVLSTSLHAFPLVNHAGLGWTLRTSSLWQLPAVQRAGKGRAGGRLSRSKADEIGRKVREMLVEDMGERPADVVFVHKSPAKQGLGRIKFDIVAYLRTDPNFAELWLGYEYVESHGWIDVYVRRDRG